MFHFIYRTDGETAQILFIVLFVLFIGIILTPVILRGIKNLRSPRLTVNAEIANKRIQKVRHVRKRHGTGTRVTHSNLYYITFQTENGSEIELWIRNRDKVYKALKIGDRGKLTYQGTKYLGFEKEKKQRKKTTSNHEKI